MKNNWTKTILYVYKYLERVCDGIDALVEESALHSFHHRSENEASRVAERICKLCERKAKLVNIKVLADTCLLKSDKTSAQLLIEKYIDEDQGEDIALRHNINFRTYFRKMIQAETSFSILMLREGFSESKLNEYLKDEKWIIEVYEKFENENSGEMQDIA